MLLLNGAIYARSRSHQRNNRCGVDSEWPIQAGVVRRHRKASRAPKRVHSENRMRAFHHPSRCLGPARIRLENLAGSVKSSKAHRCHTSCSVRHPERTDRPPDLDHSTPTPRQGGRGMLLVATARILVDLACPPGRSADASSFDDLMWQSRDGPAPGTTTSRTFVAPIMSSPKGSDAARTVGFSTPLRDRSLRRGAAWRSSFATCTAERTARSSGQTLGTRWPTCGVTGTTGR
jgi:hypothetical protein